MKYVDETNGAGWKALTARERDVIHPVAEGKSNKLIARNLRLCEATVKLHVRQIMRKLGASNRTQVAIYCSTDGAVESILRANGEGIAANNETGDEEAPLLPNGRSDTGLS